MLNNGIQKSEDFSNFMYMKIWSCRIQIQCGCTAGKVR